VTLNLAELFSDQDLSQPLPAGLAAVTSEHLTFSYALIGGDQAWINTSLAGLERPVPAIQLRDGSATDALSNDLLSLTLPGVTRTQQTSLRLFATDSSGSQASQDVTLTITPRLQLPGLATLTAPPSIGQGTPCASASCSAPCPNWPIPKATS
jgi:hypothetical protein